MHFVGVLNSENKICLVCSEKSEVPHKDKTASLININNTVMIDSLKLNAVNDYCLTVAGYVT
jgi:hypothetical protein